MNSRFINFNPDEQHLGGLAMMFRGTRNEQERRAIAEEYSQTVERLIRSGRWQEVPAPEDQLPDAWMPPAFFEYWFGESNAPTDL